MWQKLKASVAAGWHAAGDWQWRHQGATAIIVLVVALLFMAAFIWAVECL
jgi:hypothetical protein